MRVVLFAHDTRIEQVRTTREPLELLVIDQETGALQVHTAVADLRGIRDAFAHAGAGDIDVSAGTYIVVDRTTGGVVHLIADAPGLELLVRTYDEPGIPIWIGSVDAERVEELFAHASRG